MTRAIRLSDRDFVAVLIDPAVPGDAVLGVVARDHSGHKIALVDMSPGSTAAEIRPADRHRDPRDPRGRARAQPQHRQPVVDTDGRATEPQIAPTRPSEAAWFDGYVRGGGGVGTRNVIGVIASVNCSATVVRRVARRFEDRDIPGIDAWSRPSPIPAAAGWRRPATASRRWSGR
ncbi:UxaA family hydrolase [Sphingomonas sp. MMS24-JH45]